MVNLRAKAVVELLGFLHAPCRCASARSTTLQCAVATKLVQAFGGGVMCSDLSCHGGAGGVAKAMRDELSCWTMAW